MNDYSSVGKIDLFEYLCIRVKQIGVQSIHGVPGDFNLIALDYIEKCGLRWVGNCNELNAGYAADGYARVNGMSVLMTVMGVGELSAINAVAGAFAEYIPIIHIVSQPSRQAQEKKPCLHHTLGDGNFDAFEEMSRRMSCMAVSIDSPQNAASSIDDAIRQCWIQSRPVTIFLPSDMIRIPISSHDLKFGPQISRAKVHEDIPPHEEVIDVILNEIQESKSPVIIVGGHGVLHGARQELESFLRSVNIPFLVAASGWGIINTELPNYRGLYVGNCSENHVIEARSSADLVISIGNIQSDLSTPGLGGIVDHSCLIQIERYSVSVKGQSFPKNYIKNVLLALKESVARLELPLARSVSTGTLVTEDQDRFPTKENNTKMIRIPIFNCLRNSTRTFRGIWRAGTRINQGCTRTRITHDWLWKALGEWLQSGDIVLAETGTASFGIWNTRPPRDSILISQYLWSSIGYTMGACQGAALAAEENTRRRSRTILFIGDGSFQCGCQELSTIIRQGLKPIIFVICNNGYTVERLIHGEKQGYNDIQLWNHRLLPAAFGAKRGTYQTHRVGTTEQLRALFGSTTFTDCSVLQLVELVVATDDAPSNLVQLARSLQPRNNGPSALGDRS